MSVSELNGSGLRTSPLLASTDAEVWAAIEAEARRQATTLELIASENHTSPAVMAAMGTCLTNKYAEGYPGARYYGGCQHVDVVEDLARERAKKLFGCAHVNVQPHSGAQANGAVFFGLLDHGDTFASLVLADGGHLSHGMKINLSGRYYRPVHYPLCYDRHAEGFEQIDYDAVRTVCLEHKPKMILCGYSAYPRVIDFERFRRIADECGALLMADIAHIAGLVAGGVHPSPFPWCDVVTTTTHKTLRGPRGGMIMTNNDQIAKKIDKAVFPGIQGGPLMHVIAAKAVCLGEALQPAFKRYAQQVISNARALASALVAKGYRLVSGGTDNHLMLLDLRSRNSDLTGASAEQWLEAAGMIVNKNGIPQDPRPPRVTSGLRLGTPATTTRGLEEPHMAQIAGWIDRVIDSQGDPTVAQEVLAQVQQLCEQHPISHG